MKTKPTPLAPIEARTLKQVSALPKSHIDIGKDFWFLIDPECGTVTLSEQPMGGERKSHVTMPRKLFDQLARWYVTGKRGKP